MRHHRPGKHTARAPGSTRPRRGIRALLVAVSAVAALALDSSIALADKGDPLPWTDLGVTLTAPASVTTGQSFTVTASVTSYGSPICPLPADVYSSWSSSVPGDTVTVQAGGCSAQITASSSGPRSISHYVARARAKGIGAYATVTANDPAPPAPPPPPPPPPTDPNAFDPAFKLRKGRYDCYMSGSVYTFSLDFTSPSQYTYPPGLSSPFGAGSQGTYRIESSTAALQFLTGAMSRGFNGATAIRASESTTVFFTVSSPSAFLRCYQRYAQ